MLDRATVEGRPFTIHKPTNSELQRMTGLWRGRGARSGNGSRKKAGDLRSLAWSTNGRGSSVDSRSRRTICPLAYDVVLV